MKHRLFLAIELPQKLYAPTAAIQLNLKKISPLVSAVELDSIHLTTNFMGAVEEQRMPGIIKILETEIAAHEAFTIRPYFLSSFYKRHEPSVVFLEPAGQLEELKILQRDISEHLRKLQLPNQERFSPHFTIARVERVDPTSAKQVLDKIHDKDIEPLDEIHVDHISLFESKHTKYGSVYRKQGEFTLG